MNFEPRTPDELLDLLRADRSLTDRQRDAIFDRLVEAFPIEQLLDAALGRLDDLAGADADAVLRLVEAAPHTDLLERLAGALVAQTDLSPERAWDALAVLDGA